MRRLLAAAAAAAACLASAGVAGEGPTAAPTAAGPTATLSAAPTSAPTAPSVPTVTLRLDLRQPTPVVSAEVPVDVVIEVNRTLAPIGANRFLELAEAGFFNGSVIFRVIPGFVAQFGISPNDTLNERWLDSNIPDDPVVGTNTLGTVAFATDGPDTRSSEVFVNLANNSRLDRAGFAVFGRVTQGLPVLRQLTAVEINETVFRTNGTADALARYPDANVITAAWADDLNPPAPMTAPSTTPSTAALPSPSPTAVPSASPTAAPSASPTAAPMPSLAPTASTKAPTPGVITVSKEKKTSAANAGISVAVFLAVIFAAMCGLNYRRNVASEASYHSVGLSEDLVTQGGWSIDDDDDDADSGTGDVATVSTL